MTNCTATELTFEPVVRVESDEFAISVGASIADIRLSGTICA